MRRSLIAAAILLSTAGMQTAWAAPTLNDMPPPGEAIMKQADTPTGSVMEEQSPISGVEGHVLTLGRSVYRNLLRAQNSAFYKDEIDTRLALDHASGIIDSFYQSAGARALRQQMGIIREQMKNEGLKPDAGLWLPLEAEMDSLVVTATPEQKASVSKAVQEGKAAAEKGDRATANQKLDVIEQVLDYRWGMLPLDTIRGDLHSAEMSMQTTTPYWKGVSEAVSHALAAVQWVTTTDASGWLSAYDEAVSARYALPKAPDTAREYLQQAADNLQALPGAQALVKQAQDLAGQENIAPKSVDALISAMRNSLPGTVSAPH